MRSLFDAAPDSGRPDSVHIVLPPARPDVAWLDPDSTESPRAQAAMQMFGEVPSSAFEPQSLRNAFTEVFRGDMFVSAWPSFGVTGDSTTLAMSVVSRPKSEVLIAFAYDNDYHARLNTTLVLRPLRSRLPDKISVGFTIDPLRKNLFFALEPHSLARGSNGWFLRGGWRETDVRLFDEDRRIDETRVERVEAMVGGQKRLTRSYVLQAGAGYGFAGTEHRDLYAMMLEDFASVTTASRGEDALVIAGAEPPDAIILDVMMPGLDGWRVCECLRANPITARIPVIMLTSLDTADMTARAREAGAAAVLMKPCPVERLVLTLNASIRPEAARR